jgi:predicted membrane metal-binding protein
MGLWQKLSIQGLHMLLHAKIKPASPLLIPLVFLIAGIYWQAISQNSCAMLSVFLGILFMLYCYFWITQKDCSIVALGLVFFSGAWALAYDSGSFNIQGSRFSSRAASIEAKVEDKKWIPGNPYPYQYRLNATPAPPSIDAYTSTIPLICYAQKSCWWRVGDTIRFDDPRVAIPGQLAFSQGPGFNHYLAKEGCAGSVFTTRPWTRTLYRPFVSIQRSLNTLRQKIYCFLFFRLNRQTFNFFSSIFLGLKTFSPSDPIKEQFGCWGLSHYLARSGLHIVLFIIIWNWILCFIPLSFIFKNSLLLAIAYVYGLLSYSSISFLRATYVFYLFQIGKLSRSSSLSFAHLLALIGLIILLFNPLQLFFLDFQLSFFITLALTLSSFFTSRAQP